MKELTTRPQADAIIWAIGALGLIGGPLAAWIAHRRGASATKYGLAVGGSLVLVTILWHVYNAIEDKLGLDSVAALAINFGIFVVLGGVIGVIWAVFYGRVANEAPDSNPATTTLVGE